MEIKKLFVYKKLTPKEIQFYKENGYLLVGKTLTPPGVKEMLEQCMEVWDEEKEIYDPNKSWLQNSLLVDIHKKSSVVRDFYFEGPAVDMMEQLISPNIKAATSQLTFKMRGNTKTFDWHQDNGYGE